MADLTGMLQAAAGAAGGEIEPLGVDYDGSADYLSRATDLTGNSDGKTFTFSAWLYPTVQPSAGFFFDIADPVGGVPNPKPLLYANLFQSIIDPSRNNAL
jgi:hypothetical protein